MEGFLKRLPPSQRFKCFSQSHTENLSSRLTLCVQESPCSLRQLSWTEHCFNLLHPLQPAGLRSVFLVCVHQACGEVQGWGVASRGSAVIKGGVPSQPPGCPRHPHLPKSRDTSHCVRHQAGLVPASLEKARLRLRRSQCPAYPSMPVFWGCRNPSTTNQGAYGAEVDCLHSAVYMSEVRVSSGLDPPEGCE